jgi:histidinol dehydrogenase
MIKTLHTKDADFEAELVKLLSFEQVSDDKLTDQVRAIIDDVRARGDQAVLEYTQQWDQHPATSFDELVLSAQTLKAAFDGLEADVAAALGHAATRVQAFHERQKGADWSFEDAEGNWLGQKVTPLDRAGIYVPGGLASYPSSVLMNAIPAKVAGVSEIIMVVPAPKGELSSLVLAAAHLAGVDKVITVGGAQAVSALAYGTQSIPRVDKITGPGNRYVAEAKRQVFGQVGIDMIAGPSEILIYAEGTNDPEWLAADFLSQAEHDTVAQSILITPDAELVEPFVAATLSMLAGLPKAQIARESVANRGAVIVTRDRAEALELINRIAPEHLELCVDEPQEMLPMIRHAGAIFMGRHTPEAIGDYCAGPNHVLPTSSTARFSSPLGVYDFQKRSSLIQCSPSGVQTLARTAQVLAIEEGLEAHARSAELRISPNSRS